MFEEFDFSPTAEQRRRQQMMLLAQLGFGLLGARKGREGEAIGRAGFGAMHGYQQGLLDTEQGNMQRHMLQQRMAEGRAKQEEAERARQDAAGVQSQLGEIFAPGGGGNAAGGSAQYRQAAALLAQRGQIDAAKKLSDIADSMDKGGEYDATPRVGIVDGKPAFGQFNKRGEFKAHAGFTPPPDNRVVNTGGQQRIVDMLTTAPGTAFDVTMDPAQIAANRIAQGNLAVSQGNLGLSRERFKYDQGKDAQARTDAAAGVLKPKNPTEFEAKSALFADQMRSASTVIDELKGRGFTGAGSQQIGLTAAGASGLMGTLPRAMASEAAQVYNQAADQWSEAYLRVKTGAAATTDEVRKNRETFFPVPGESRTSIARKEIARREAERAVFGAAGNAAARVPEAAVASPLTPAESAELAELRKRFGRK